MLKNLELIEWIKLLVACILFLGPGALKVTLLSIKPKRGVNLLILYFIFSAAFWIILLNMLRTFKLYVITPEFIIAISTIGWGLYILYAFRSRFWTTINITSFEIQYILVCCASFLLLVYSLRNQVAGLGSDSFHHTLLSQLIIWNNGLPVNYMPAYPDIITLNYHTGFHIVSAILSLLSGLNTRLIILLMVPFLVIGSSFAIGYFISEWSDNYFSFLYATIVPLCLTSFPYGMLEWGRYPQTLGLIFLVIFFSEYIKRTNEQLSIKNILIIAIIGSSIVYVHYRVSIMTLVGILFWEIGDFLVNKNPIQRKNRLKNFLILGGSCLMFLLPLILSLLNNLSIGYSDPIQHPSAPFYKLNRLGEHNIFYIPHLFVLAMLMPAIVMMYVHKERIANWISIWWGSMTILSFSVRETLTYSIDPITIISSLYVPLGLLVGIGFIKFLNRTSEIIRLSTFYIIVVISFMLLFVRLEKTVPVSGYVNPEDLIASRWINNHTQPNSCFMINTYNFDFSPNFIIGSDGGWWLPILTRRCVLAYPMTTSVERFSHPNALNKIVTLHKLHGDISNKAALEIMRKYNIKYVYTSNINRIGGSYIDPFKLKKSPFFKLIYKNRSVLVFKVLY
jgi:hypothetical protein